MVRKQSRWSGFAYDAAVIVVVVAGGFRIHGFEPHDVVPTTELIRFHAHPRTATRHRDARACDGVARSVQPLPTRRRAGTTRRVLILGSGSGVEGPSGCVVSSST
jgi:hypothetical protein